MALEIPVGKKIVFANSGDLMAGLYELLTATIAGGYLSDSTWTPVHATGSPNGKTSWCFKSTEVNAPDGFQINMRTVNTTAQILKVTVNRGDDITDSNDPAGSDQFPEEDFDISLAGGGSALALLFKDELIVLFENSSNRYYWGLYLGRFLYPLNADLAIAPTWKLDGLGVLYAVNQNYIGTHTEHDYNRNSLFYAAGHSSSARSQTGDAVCVYPRRLNGAPDWHTYRANGLWNPDVLMSQEDAHAGVGDGYINAGGAQLITPIIISSGGKLYAADGWIYGWFNHCFRGRSTATATFSAKDKLYDAANNQLIHVRFNGPSSSEGFWIAMDPTVLV